MRKTLLCALLVPAFALATACSDDPKPTPPTVTPPTAADAGAAKPAEKPADKAAKPAEPGKDAAAQKDAPKATGPVAKVNTIEITRAQYDEQVGELQKRFAMFGGNIPEAQLARFKQKIIERMVDDELVKQEIAKANLTVSDEEVTKEFDTYKSKTPGGPENFDKFLERSGMSVDNIKGDIKRRLALKKFLNKDGALKVGDPEMQEYYKTNMKRFEVKERVKARHILIKMDKAADAKAQAAAKKEIDAIYKEAKKKGTDFAELAKAKSQGPSGPRGGDLGWFGKGKMVKEFETAGFAMKPGEISKPLKTQFGWHVLKVEEKEAAGQKKFDDVKDDIRDKLEARQFREARNKLLDRLRAEGKVEVLEKIEIPASKPASMGGGPGGMPGGIKINPKPTIKIPKGAVAPKPAGGNAPAGKAAPKK
jgi:peptidyl-prolyl cis-trans isomerase C